MVDDIETSDANGIGRSWVSECKSKAGLPSLRISAELMDEVECLGFQSLVGSWIPSYFDGLLNLQETSTRSVNPAASVACKSRQLGRT